MPDPTVFGESFGWYHRGTATLGVILCAPHGYEELCVHRHWRNFAENLAAQGLPTLRFDYPGTGDSADDSLASGEVRGWIESIRQATDVLRTTAGVGRIALVGLRMGALLAAAAAERIEDLAGLVLMAPFESGDACFRELRALAMIRAPGRHRQNATVSAAGGLEAAGFSYSPETLADLRALRLLESGRPPAEKILVLGRPNAAADQKFRSRLAASGAVVEEETFTDYPVLLRNADLAVYPEEGFGRVAGWLKALNGQTAKPEPVPVQRPAPVLRLESADERPVFFNRDPDFFGVLCEPRLSTSHPLLVFLNTGANHHIGTSRMTVTMARRFAESGFPSLRLDIGGVGDSDAPAGRGAHHPSNSESITDVRRALDWLQAHGYNDFVMVGLCSGAKLALETTLADDRVNGQVLLNLQGFWKISDFTNQYASRRTYFRLARHASSWGRMLRGEVDMHGIAKSVIKRSAAALSADIREALNGLRRHAGRRGAGIAEFRRLARRRVKTSFIYVEEDPGLDELEIVFGRNGRSLAGIPNLSMRFLAEGDHIFSWDYSRQNLFSTMDAELAWIETARRSNSSAAVRPPGLLGTSLQAHQYATDETSLG